MTTRLVVLTRNGRCMRECWMNSSMTSPSFLSNDRIRFFHATGMASDDPAANSTIHLAYRRSILGMIREPHPVRLSTGTDASHHQPRSGRPQTNSSLLHPTPPPPASNVHRLPFIFAHCLLGDSRQFTRFEEYLHTELKRVNQTMSGTDDQIELDVWNLDLRNHGESPHTHLHNYDVIVKDLRQFILDHDIQRPIMCGHSMGGKSILSYALTVPASTSIAPTAIISLDAAPATYSHVHSSIFTAMTSIDFQDPTFHRRKDIEDRLKLHLASPADRAFVMSNLVDHSSSASPSTSSSSTLSVSAPASSTSSSSPSSSSTSSKFSWRVNLPILLRDERHVHGWTIPQPKSVHSKPGPSFHGPALFIGGGKSSRLTTPSYTSDLPAYFPHHRLEMIPTGGHFVHQSHGRECAEWIVQWIQQECAPLFK